MKMRNAGLPFIAAFVLLAIPGAVNCTNAQANDNGRVLVASGVLKLASHAEVSALGINGSLPKRFLVPFNGIVRVKWKIKTDASGQPASIGASSLLGTCFTGTNLSTTSQTYVNGTCDLRVVAGDIVSVSVRGSMGNFDPPTPDTTGFMKDVTLSFTVQNGTGLGQVLP